MHGRAPVFFAPVRAADRDPATAPQVVTLTELRASPVRYLEGPVRFVFQARRRSADWNPYHTRFTPEEWLGLSGWGDERFAWTHEVWSDPATRLFVRRGTEAAIALGSARPGERFAVEARVGAIFAGQPWIEITSAKRLERMVGHGTLLCAARALEAMADERWARAVQELNRALAAYLPTHAQAELERLRIECRQLAVESARR